MHIFRVTVRGRFDGLDEGARERLAAVAEEHDHMHARFTEAGTLTYDRRLDFFSFRVQQREREADHAGAAEASVHAAERAIEQAGAAVQAFGASFRDLRITSTDMADMWADEPESAG